MEYYYIIHIGIATIFYAIFDVVHDRSSSVATWRTSILKSITMGLLKMDEDKALNSFLGPKDYTWDRKNESKQTDKKTKSIWDKLNIFAKLKRSVFVMFTDIWHLSDTIKRVSWHYILFIVLTTFMPFLSALIFSVVNYIIFAILFHMNYHYVFDNSVKPLLRTSLFFALVAGALAIYTVAPKLSGEYINFKVGAKTDIMIEEIRRENDLLDSINSVKVKTITDQLLVSQQTVDSLNIRLSEIENKIETTSKQNPNWRNILLDFINNK